jgi:hypothetical protein
MAPRKKVAKKAAAKAVEVSPESELDQFFSVQAGTGEVPSLKLERDWPERIIDKHKARWEENQQRLEGLRNEKKQKMIDNGVPPEKHSI